MRTGCLIILFRYPSSDFSGLLEDVDREFFESCLYERKIEFIWSRKLAKIVLSVLRCTSECENESDYKLSNMRKRAGNHHRPVQKNFGKVISSNYY